jgi:hypothetical protein
MTKIAFMKIHLHLWLIGLCFAPAAAHAAAPFLVENGESRAEIIIAESPARSTRLAAADLQTYIAKISGAQLPIETKPSADIEVQIYVGESPHAAKLGVTADGLEHGAYRIASGENWLALIGDDSDFEPVHPFARNNGDKPRAQAEWEKLVGASYGMPSTNLYKNRLRLPGEIGKPEGVVTDKKETFEIWGLDERGSFNAVCGYLRKLGVRWYLPGELGEVIPEIKSIPLPQIDETVMPDFPLRQFNFRFSTAGYHTSMWAMRLGTRNDERYQVAHGMSGMTNNEKVFAEHPEWFALYGGKRDFKPGNSKCQLCYSDKGLFQETVRYTRALLDTYPFKCVSVMPPDGYTAICQCEKCLGKDSPDRHERGKLSDHVWGFTNRVAKEIAKTHPEAKVCNAAYGAYTLPPNNIDKLEPNVLVCIVGGRRPINKAGYKGAGEAAPEVLRAGWAKKTDNPIIFFENFPFTDRGWYLPSFTPQALTKTVNATKGISMGEDIWLSAGRDFDTVDIGFNHFIVYFTARMYWGGKEADGDAMFHEYCRLFYGPAGEEMKAFFTYCEVNWKAMESDKTLINTAFDLFSRAQANAGSDSAYGQRIALIDYFLKGLRMKSTQLAQKRGPVPKVRLLGEATDIVIDGKLDDAYWQKCAQASRGKLYELQTGRTPTFGTTFKSGWLGNSVYFAIRCDELPGTKPVNAATRDDDTALWHGDAIEIEIATETHSYYQIAISPGGEIVDLDREAAKGSNLRWSSKAEVATRVEDDHWTVEIRIPVTQDANDPYHQVIGRKPTQSLPWHINICRQRIREHGQEFSALSPTGIRKFHVPMKFAHFYAGKSHKFESDPEVTDFAIGYRNAAQARKADAFLALAEIEQINDFQKSAALEQAAYYSRKEAAPIVEQIPIEVVKKTSQMQHLLIQGKAPEVISQFATEDITQWPFWKRGDGYRNRGRAYYITKDGAKAETDLSKALPWTSEPEARDAVLLMLAQNREGNLGDDARAFEAYDAIVVGRERIGGANQLYALQGIARIQTKRGQFEEALKTLDRANADKLQGSWKKHILKSIEEVNAARRGVPK